MRTYGLSGSGMDVDQLVKDMMKARRASYDKLWQKKTQLEYKKGDYNTIYTTLRDFRNTTVFNYKLQSTLMPKTVSSTEESKVSATANADAANVSHTLNVTQLAEGAKLTSAGSISLATDKTSLSTQFGITTGTFRININDKEIAVDSSKSIYELVSTINNTKDIGVKANYDATLDRFFIYTTDTGANAKIKFSASSDPDPSIGVDFVNKTLKLASVTTFDTTGQAGTALGVADTGLSTTLSDSRLGMTVDKFVLKLTNGTTTKDITILKTDMLSDLIGKINGTGIANADYSADQFSLKAAPSGTLSIAGSDQIAIDFLKNKLKLSSIQQTLPPIITGQDAQFNLDGVNLTQTGNNFTISGVTYNLKALGQSNVTVSGDNDKAIASVKSFIDSYNSTLEKINAELKEEKYSDYLPLTSDQKKDMKESEITEWEKRAKSGMLRRDSILQNSVYKLRSDVSTPISGLTGKYNSLASIGVTTGDYTEDGKLYLDETKLKKALEEDPDVLNHIFGTSGTTLASQGVAVRLYDTLKTTMDKIVTVGGYSGTIDDDSKSSLAQQIRSYNTELSNMDDRLQDIEDRYYKQFDAMETALSKMNQQSSWLSQQFSS